MSPRIILLSGGSLVLAIRLGSGVSTLFDLIFPLSLETSLP
jgi:hypothetical protein